MMHQYNTLAVTLSNKHQHIIDTISKRSDVYVVVYETGKNDYTATAYTKVTNKMQIGVCTDSIGLSLLRIIIHLINNNQWH